MKATAVTFPSSSVVAGKAPLAVRFGCDLDCAFWARLERLPMHATVTGVRGRIVGGEPARALVRRTKKLRPGLYRFTLRLTAALNPGTPKALASRAFRVR